MVLKYDFKKDPAFKSTFCVRVKKIFANVFFQNLNKRKKVGGVRKATNKADEKGKQQKRGKKEETRGLLNLATDSQSTVTDDEP